MLFFVRKNCQVFNKLTPESVFAFNYSKLFPFARCTSCNQQRVLVKYCSQQQGSRQTQSDAETTTDNLKEISSNFQKVGIQHLFRKWLGSLSVFSVEPIHKCTSTGWKTSHTSSRSFFQNKHGFQKTQVRNYFKLFRSSEMEKNHWHNQSLKLAADRQPNDPELQARYLQSILYEDPGNVIQRYESGKYATFNDECTQIYLKALSRNGTKGRQQDILYVKNVEKNGFDGWYWFWKVVRVIAVAFLYLILLMHFLSDREGKSHIKTVKPEVINKEVNFDYVQGCTEAKEELQEIVEFLKNPEKFQKLGGKVPTGVLLTGSPGVGKTLLARAAAGEASVPFFFSSGSEFDEVYVGVGAARIRELFAAAKESSPAIIFIDEIDAVGGKRVTNKFSSYGRNTLNQLLVELDGFNTDDSVIVIGATNFPESLDSALTRTGRFDTKIHISLPTVKDRKEIIKMYLDKLQIAADVNVEILAKGTSSFSGADIANFINQAAIRAAVEGASEISMKHLLSAIEKNVLGPENRITIISESDKRGTAVHEAGHALVGLKGGSPVYKATILPRSQALGFVATLPEDEFDGFEKRHLLRDMDLKMGGIVAEELFYGESGVTTGCYSDMKMCTKIARKMVMEYSMSEELGIGVWNSDDMSQATKKRVDCEVQRLLQEAHDRAKAILTEYKHEHQLLIEALMLHETLSKEEMLLVIEGKELPAKEV